MSCRKIPFNFERNIEQVHTWIENPLLRFMNIPMYQRSSGSKLFANFESRLKKEREREREREREKESEREKLVFFGWFLRHLEASPSILLQLLSLRTHGMYYRSHWQYYIWVQSGSKLFANVNREKEREKERDRAFTQSDQCLYTVLIRKMCASCIVG